VVGRHRTNYEIHIYTRNTIARARKNNVRPCPPKNGQPVTVGTKVANMKKHLPVQHCRPSVGRRSPSPHTNQKITPATGKRRTRSRTGYTHHCPSASCSMLLALSGWRTKLTMLTVPIKKATAASLRPFDGRPFWVSVLCGRRRTGSPFPLPPHTVRRFLCVRVSHPFNV